MLCIRGNNEKNSSSFSLPHFYPCCYLTHTVQTQQLHTTCKAQLPILAAALLAQSCKIKQINKKSPTN